jgi:hypothetical protein
MKKTVAATLLASGALFVAWAGVGIGSTAHGKGTLTGAIAFTGRVPPGYAKKPVHAHNGRYSVSQVRHVVAGVGLTCKRSPTFAGLVILGCRNPGSPYGLSAFIGNPNFRGPILYGLSPVPGMRYTKRRNVTLEYRPAARPLAQIVLSLMR